MWSKKILKQIDRGSAKFVYNIVTGNETWIYSYKLETKPLFGCSKMNSIPQVCS